MPYDVTEFSLSELALVALLLALALVASLLSLRLVRRVAGQRRADATHPLAGRRLIVLLELVVGGALAVVAARWLAHGGPVWSHALGLALFLAAIAAFWFALREYAAGLVLRATDTLREGDSVKAAGVEGRVKVVGRLWLILESRNAVEARLPWTRVLAAPLERSAAQSRDAQHHFHVSVPAALDPAAAIAIARETILTTHGAHPARDPEITLGADRTLEIHVTTLLPAAAGTIEAAVRAALGA